MIFQPLKIIKSQNPQFVFYFVKRYFIKPFYTYNFNFALKAKTDFLTISTNQKQTQ